ncbi:MAG: DUF1552 domain-containing protein [Lentisphaeraceae bacterium]|nr:DUF1552 domain-containing protein [Lentisphaeraceae bacterium]
MKNTPSFIHTGFNRRNFLKGAGVSLMLPQMASLAKDKKDPVNPVRMAFLHVPNGMIMDKFRPKKYGTGYEITQTLEPLREFKKDFQLIDGLKHEKAGSNGDGAGPHARAQGTFLTGVQVLKSAKDARAGISVDQVAAKYKGNESYLPSLELAAGRGRVSGKCDSGYSCLYQFALSWKDESVPMLPEYDPAQAFKRLFTYKDPNQKATKKLDERAKEKSVLDFMLDNSKSLQRRLGKEDTEKLDQYFSNLRELEKRIDKDKPIVTPDMMTREFVVQKDYREHLDTLLEVMVLAFQVDATRISTIILGDEGNARSFPEIGVKGGHHNLSHHRDDPKMVAAVEKIDLMNMQRLAYFMRRLKEVKVDGKSLLDQSMIVYGGSISDGNKHLNTNLPIVLAGHGGGLINPGIHRKYDDTPMSNLYVTMLQKFGCPVEKFGDSNGSLPVI